MFQSHVPFAKIPYDGIILARVSDNVLEDTDWGVYKLLLKDGVVVEQSTINKGVYVIDPFVGMATTQLALWSSYDSTGRHPENYHELEVPDD